MKWKRRHQRERDRERERVREREIESESLKRIWNENKYQKDKRIEDKQRKGNYCQNTQLHIGRKETEQVTEFSYLGSMITTDVKCHREIKEAS